MKRTIAILIIGLFFNRNCFAQLIDKTNATHSIYFGAGGRHYTFTTGLGYNKAFYFRKIPVVTSIDFAPNFRNRYNNKLREFGFYFDIGYSNLKYKRQIIPGIGLNFSYSFSVNKGRFQKNFGQYEWIDGPWGEWTSYFQFYKISYFIKYQNKNGGFYSMFEAIPHGYVPDKKPYTFFSLHPFYNKPGHGLNIYLGLDIGYTFGKCKKEKTEQEMKL